MGFYGISIKLVAVTVLLFGSFYVSGQVRDDFADGNLDQQPLWEGDTSNFRINNKAQLRLDAPASATPATIYTSGSFQADTLEWRVWLKLDFSPSDQNQALFHLALDSPPTSSAVKGYWLQLGENGQNDGIDLYRKDANQTQKIIDGQPGFLLKGPKPIHIRVRRFPGGQWQIAADSNGGQDWVRQGQATDAKYQQFRFTGLEARFTSTRADRFYFDSFYQGPFQPDTIPPTLQNLTIRDSQTLRLRFSEPLPNGAISNIRLKNGNRQLTAISPPDQRPSLLDVRISPPLNNKTRYQLILINLADKKGNTTNDTFPFAYVVPESGDVQFSELMPDPTPSRGLSPVEYVEVYNTLPFAIDLKGWTLSDPANKGSIETQSHLPAKSTKVLAATPALKALKQDGLKGGVPVQNMPNLNNGGEILTLVTERGDTVDQVTYKPSWYRIDSLSDGGYSLAKVNPLSPCSGGRNWRGSKADSGGTPGVTNAVWNPFVDSVPPKVRGIAVKDSNQIVVRFDEPVRPDTPIQQPASFFQIQPNLPFQKARLENDTTIQLSFQQGFQPDVTYQLSVSKLPDCWGNQRQQPQQLNFTYFSPFGAERGDVMLNEILPDPTPSQGLPPFEYVEVVNRSNRAFSLEDWSYGDDGNTVRLPDTVLRPGEYGILIPENALPTFGAMTNVIPLSSWPSLNNGQDALFLRAPSGKTIDTLAYDKNWYADPGKADGGYSLERINPLSPCNGQRDWRASNADSGGTPGRPNSVVDSFRDTIPPKPGSLKVLDSNKLLITFNEPVKRPLSQPLKAFISIQPAVLFQKAAFNSDTTLEITYQGTFESNTTYQLQVQGFPDCWGNQSLQPRQLAFTYVSPFGAERRAITFNELLPDPTPSQGLPAFEYTELYNRTGQPVSLRKWTYQDGSSQVTLPDTVIPAKTTLLLLPEAADTAFADSIKKLPLINWPTLNNGGDQLIVKSPAGKTIDSLNYDDTWYNNPGKAEGGWALAQVNPNHPCSGPGNWRGSTDSMGGTPGQQNAVYDTVPDTTAPTVAGIQVIDSQTLRVTFSERVEVASLQAGNWQLKPGIKVQTLQSNASALTREALVELQSSMVNQQRYFLQFEGIRDCWGNRLRNADSVTFTYLKPEPAGLRDLLVTEIMRAPEPTVGLPPYEYIELTNVSDKVLALQDLRLLVDSQPVNMPEQLLKPDTSLVLTDPLGAAALLEEGQAIGVPSLPTLINASGRITLRNQMGALVHTVAYRDDWYNGSFKEEGGWSLEMVALKDGCIGKGNWRPSKASKGGTPGQPNSVSANNPKPVQPKLDQLRVVDSQTLRLTFNRRMDSLSLLRGMYQIVPDLEVEQVVPRTPLFRSVRLELNQPAEQGTIYTFQVENLEGCAGRDLPQRDRRWGIPVKPGEGDLLINEVLFNPSDDGADFVELFNASDQVVSLDRLRLANRDDQDQIDDLENLPKGQLLPGAYLVLTEEPAAVSDNFRVKNPLQLWGIDGLPTYANDEGTVVLFRKDGKVLDEVSYLEEWHTPLIDDPAGVSLERISSQQLSDDADNWQSAAETAGFGTPTYENSQTGKPQQAQDAFSFSSKVFSPDQDGRRDFLRLHYQLPKDGFLATINIYDTKGRKVRQLANNALLGREGSLKWDGTRDDGQSVAQGVYILQGQLFHPDGDKRSFQKSVTVGRR